MLQCLITHHSVLMYVSLLSASCSLRDEASGPLVSIRSRPPIGFVAYQSHPRCVTFGTKTKEGWAEEWSVCESVSLGRNQRNSCHSAMKKAFLMLANFQHGMSRWKTAECAAERPWALRLKSNLVCTSAVTDELIIPKDCETTQDSVKQAHKEH